MRSAVGIASLQGGEDVKMVSMSDTTGSGRFSKAMV